MLRSLYSGISGMKVNQTKMDVIGNNIANVGTTSFKSQRVRFQDMLSQNVTEAMAPGTNVGGTNPRQVGLGVQLAGIDTIATQGMMQPTSRNLDVAVDGDGYLMVGRGEANFSDAKTVEIKADHTIGNPNGMNIMYTRDGALTLDNDGNLLTPDGYRVLGYSVSNSVSGTAIPAESIQGTSGNGLIEGNVNFIDGNGTLMDGKNVIIDAEGAKLTGSVDLNAGTGLAAPVSLSLSMDGQQKTINLAAGDKLDDIVNKINLVFAGAASKSGNNLVLQSSRVGNQSMITLDAASATALGVAAGPSYGKFHEIDSATNQVVIVDASNKPEILAPKVATEKLKPLRIPDKIIETVITKGDEILPSTVPPTYKMQTETREIRIKTFSIEKDGTIKGVLEDGRVSILGQVAMASFKNPAGLSKQGKNIYQNSANSGEPVVRSGLGADPATDNSKGYGDMLQGMLEMSNVDLAEQFTDMIVTSRAFQANSKVITTGDEILQDILNLKR